MPRRRKKRKIIYPIAEISREITNNTIGFARVFTRDNVEDAVCAGSGTLVSIGSVRGILTAAHVVEAWEHDAEIGIIDALGNPPQFRKHLVRADHAAWIKIGGQASGSNGPDIAFLRLPLENAEILAARKSFYNLSRHRDDALAHRWTGDDHLEDLVTGMIGHLTEVLPADRPLVRRIQFTAILSGGFPTMMKDVGGYDLYDFKPTSNEPNFVLPDNYEGASGGAIWRYYITAKGGTIEIVDRRLVGVPFYQWFDKGTIRYHGPRSIYGHLYDKVVEKWPDESRQ
jgi:hypothetical protein